MVSRAQYDQQPSSVLNNQTRPFGSLSFAVVLTLQGPLSYDYHYRITNARLYFITPFPATYAGYEKYDRRARCAYELLMEVGQYIGLSAYDKQAIRALGELLLDVFRQRGLPNGEYITLYLNRLG